LRYSLSALAAEFSDFLRIATVPRPRSFRPRR
jgi:hypothetical protein